jgi:hypothetical protein
MIKTILLSDCVAQVESSNCLGALRFEPGYQPSPLGVGQAAKHATGSWIDNLTAETIAKCSYGRFQIMGDNLYNAMQYTGTIWDFVASPIQQLFMFNKFAARGKFTDAPFSGLTRADINAFALYYNGSIVYADSLAKAYVELKAE